MTMGYKNAFFLICDIYYVALKIVTLFHVLHFLHITVKIFIKIWAH